MDKLNKNMFGLGVILVVAVLGGGAWKLVLEPSAALKVVAGEIRGHERSLGNYLEAARPDEGEGQILATETYADKLQDSEKKMEESFKEAAELFKTRCEKFQLFWELPKRENPSFTDIPPILADSNDFSAAYRDGNNNLREQYWAKFPVPVVEKTEDATTEEENRESKVPVIEMVKSEEISANMPRAMKQYLVTEAVFEVCSVLGIAGLQTIEFPQERAKSTSRRSGSSRKKAAAAAAAEAGGKVEYNKVEAVVDLHMQYGKLQALLAALYKSPRVPFIEPKSIEFGKLPGSLEGFSKYILQQTFKSQALADAAQAAGEPSAKEPPVRVILRLVAIDWKGAKVAGNDSDEKKTEQGK
mgnify:CR=1 FL=1|tara:strand:+ start:1130 stop:2200 length:1071 start_codon:yes stop_codon:yes gene_type:complete